MASKIMGALVFDGSVETAPITSAYEGSLDFDALLTQVMNAHAPRLNRGRHHAEYWCYRETVQTAQILVRCNWNDMHHKLGLLAFSFMPISTVNPDEIIWIADVNLPEVQGTHTELTGTDALLIVSYRAEGVYPVFFPYAREANGQISYDEPIFSGAHIPDGFVNLALRSIFTKEMSEEERVKNHETRHLAAAIAGTWGHETTFPPEPGAEETPCTV